MIRRIVALLVVVFTVWLALGRSPQTTPASGPAGSAVVVAPAVSGGFGARTDIGFQSPARLKEHYAKHGSEFGRLSSEEYLAMAQSLRDAPPGGNVLEIVRSTDGVISRFDRSTGAFLAADPDGTIRTFFRPNDGEAYFRRQANRRPSR